MLCLKKCILVQKWGEISLFFSDISFCRQKLTNLTWISLLCCWGDHSSGMTSIFQGKKFAFPVLSAVWAVLPRPFKLLCGIQTLLYINNLEFCHYFLNDQFLSTKQSFAKVKPNNLGTRRKPSFPYLLKNSSTTCKTIQKNLFLTCASEWNLWS